MSPAQCPSGAKSSDACPFIVGDIAPSVNTEGACPFATSKSEDMTKTTVHTLNQFLPETQQKKNTQQEYLSDPQLASAMKEGTKIVHTAAENSVFTKRFLAGSINKDEYGRYISSLYFVYKTMEELLKKHKADATIQMVYFPYELNREKALLKDIEYYYGKDRIAEITHESNITPAIKNYTQALREAADKNPALLIAHSYSRYLGDLSGGQILAKRLKKHVLKRDVTDATWDSYQGLEFYNFDHIGSHNEFKALYRNRLDQARVTQYTKDLIVAEAIYSFELNIALFNEIQDLSDAKKLHATLEENDIVYSKIESRLILPITTDWLVGFATGAMTFAVGLSIYHHLSERL